LLEPWPDENLNEMPLHRAVQNGRDADWNQLLEDSAENEKMDSEGKSELNWAAIMGMENAAQQLLDADSDIMAKDDEGRVALHWAARMGLEAMARLF
jgi:ankyrin repeat protein